MACGHAQQHGGSEDPQGVSGADYGSMKGTGSGEADRNQDTEGKLQFSLKAAGSHQWILSRRVTQQVWDLENKNLT